MLIDDDKSAFSCSDGKLGAVTQTRLIEQALYMRFHGTQGQMQTFRDNGVRFARYKLTQDLQLTRRKAVAESISDL